MTYSEAEEIRSYCDNHYLQDILKRARWVYDANKGITDEPFTRQDAFVFAALSFAGVLPVRDDDDHVGEKYFK